MSALVDSFEMLIFYFSLFILCNDIYALFGGDLDLFGVLGEV